MLEQAHTPVRGRGRRLLLACAAMLCATAAVASLAGAQDSLEEARKERDELREDRAKALRELESAKLADEELADLIIWLNTEIATTELAVARLRSELVVVEAELAQARQTQQDARDETARLKEEIATIAVAGFVRSTRKEEAFFSAGSIADAHRQDSLIREANAEPAELLDEMRRVQEEGRLAEAAVTDAAQATIELEAQLAGVLAGLEADQTESTELKAEYEQRVADWQAKVDEWDTSIADLTEFIIANTPPSTTGFTSAPPPSDPSVQGYQWPLVGRLSSGFGPRVHPIFGTRRMHTGLDIGGRSGEPIYAAKGGVVIFAGWRGGYGNTVVVDHGDGFSTLYAHQSQIGSAVGQEVTIGEVIGFVGSTGWSTSPHLHYELRMNGQPIDPLPYLP